MKKQGKPIDIKVWVGLINNRNKLFETTQSTTQFKDLIMS